MSFYIRILMVVLLITHSLPVHAENNQDIKNLVEQFHHGIEHSAEVNESKSKLTNLLSQWKDNFNLVRISSDTHRFAQMKYYQDSGKSEFIKNFPVMASFYFLSHTIEVFSGPMGIYVASDMGLGPNAQMLIGTIGAIISIPGLDPLCILFFAVSPLKPVQKLMTGIRIVAVKVSGGIQNQLGLKELAAKIFEQKDRLSEIVKSENSNLILNADTLDLQKQLILKSRENLKPYLVLTFSTDSNNKTWITSMNVLDVEELDKNKKDLNSVLNKLNLSARYALKRAILKPQKTFYTQAVSADGNSTNIQFKDYAVMLKPKLGLKKQHQNETLDCKSLFH